VQRLCADLHPLGPGAAAPAAASPQRTEPAARPGDSARIDALELRVAELERRLAELHASLGSA
jgi:uncharacterized protein YceH (UPF0502 family)